MDDQFIVTYGNVGKERITLHIRVWCDNVHNVTRLGIPDKDSFTVGSSHHILLVGTHEGDGFQLPQIQMAAVDLFVKLGVVIHLGNLLIGSIRSCVSALSSLKNLRKWLVKLR